MILTRLKRVLLTSVLLSVFSSAGWATTFSNPFPGDLEDDIEGSGLFQHGNQAFSIEYFDFSDIPPITSAPGSEFGFYYAGASDMLIPIFGVDDTTPVAITNNQQALVDFSLGAVFEYDFGVTGVLETLFTPQADTPIGFYLTLPTAPVTLFSQAILNSGEQDLSGAFPFIVDPNAIAIVFGTQSTGFLSLHSILPLAPAPAPVPLPGAAGLFTGYDRIGAVQAQSVQDIDVA